MVPLQHLSSSTSLSLAQLRQDIINQVDQGSLVDATNDLAPAPVSNTSCHKERELVSGVMEDGDPVPHKHSAASNSDTASSASTHVKKGTDKETKQHISRDRGGNRRDGRQRRGKLVRGTTLRTPSCHSKSSVEGRTCRVYIMWLVTACLLQLTRSLHLGRQLKTTHSSFDSLYI